MHSEPRSSCSSAKSVPMRIDALRHSLALLEGATGMIDEGVAPIELGVAEIDNALGGGLARGALHEIAAVRESAIAAANGFTLGLVARALGKAVAVEQNSRATNSACSLPPCGGGLGRGVATTDGYPAYPPPCPSPTRGEGTQEPLAQELRASALARKSVLWIAETFSLAENGALYAPGLDQAGVAPQNLLM